MGVASQRFKAAPPGRAVGARQQVMQKRRPVRVARHQALQPALQLRRDRGAQRADQQRGPLQQALALVRHVQRDRRNRRPRGHRGPLAPGLAAPGRAPPRRRLAAAAEQVPLLAADLLGIERAGAFVGNARHGLGQAAIQGGLAFRAVEDLALDLARPEQVQHRSRLIQKRAHRARPRGLDQVVRVLPRRQDHEAQRLSRPDQRQRQVDQPLRRTLARRIAVQRDHRLGRDAPHQAQLFLGDGGAQGGDGALEPGAGQGDHVHIAFGHDQALALGDRAAGRPKVVEVTPLVKQRRLGAVEVFRPRIRVHRPPAETDAAPLPVADRKDDPPPEPVIGRAAAIGAGGHASLDDLLFGKALVAQGGGQGGAVVGGEADLEPLQRRGVQAAAVQIVAGIRRGAGLQLQAEPAAGGLGHLQQPGPLVGLFAGAGVGFGHGQPGLGRQQLDRLDELHPIMVAQKPDGVALGLTTKAVVISLLVVAVKAGGFFLMKRAWRPPVAPRLVRLAQIPYDLFADHPADRDAVANLVKETGGQGHGGDYPAWRAGRQGVTRRPPPAPGPNRSARCGPGPGGRPRDTSS